MPFTAFAQQSVSSGFNASMIVPDSVFSDNKTFGGPEGIQKFLESKGSVLANTSLDFLKKLREPDDAYLKQNLDDPRHNLSRPRTAAELIWDASIKSGLNPQVILVTLNKEQGLITAAPSGDRLQRALNHSMGFGCPDGSGCDETLSGFYFQLFGNVSTEGDRYLGAATSLMKSFLTPQGRGPTINGRVTNVGDTITLDNTLGGYNGVQAKQTIKIGNRATAALYRYTPHVYNGNYNFWKFFTSWFNYANGTILKDTATNTIYIIQNGMRRQLPMFVARIRKINTDTITSASPTELSGYPLGILYQPPANTIVSMEGKLYLFLGGKRHLVSSLVLSQRNLDQSKTQRMTVAESALFPEGEQLLPKNGTILRARTKPNMYYIVEKGSLKQFSTFTLKQRNAKDRAQIVADSEIARYPKSGFVAPLDGTLVKSKFKDTVYIVTKGKKRPLTSGLFSNLEYKKKDIVILSDSEIESLAVGTYPTPKENTYFTEKETRALYVFKNRAIHLISPEVAKKQRLRGRYTFDASVIKDWPIGAPITK